MREEALSAGAVNAVVCNHWAEGGEGAVALAEAVEKACAIELNFKFLYDVEVSPTAACCFSLYTSMQLHVQSYGGYPYLGYLKPRLSERCSERGVCSKKRFSH